MTLYRFQIPIQDYYCEDVFFQHVYIESDHSPTKDELLKVLNEYHERDSEYSEYLGCWNYCMDSVRDVEEFPQLSPGLQSTNSFTQVHFPDYIERAPFSVSKIEPYIL